ncbi:MAG TPA: hypothetical protein VLG46_10845 [Anaerolineae bacterium]|nr:hypothetical protein [Anaerolineae bacterium]
MPIRAVLDKLEHAERAFLGTEFLAPIVGEGQVQVRIAGVVCRPRVNSTIRHTWAVLRPIAIGEAAVVREATWQEVAQYLALFPQVRLVLAQKIDRQWLAFPAQRGDARLCLEGPIGLWLAAEEVERFDGVEAAFDGRSFWYVQRDRRSDPAVSAYLRERFAQRPIGDLPPDVAMLHRRGLSREQCDVYAWLCEQLKLAQRDRVEVRLAEALGHAEARLHSYLERGDVYVVKYEVDGRERISTIRHDDLSVITAGICLAGQDQRFDLTSLVGVLREGERDQQLVWVGDEGMNEELYWQIHPPE